MRGVHRDIYRGGDERYSQKEIPENEAEMIHIGRREA
jgi:hypothetical protein